MTDREQEGNRKYQCKMNLSRFIPTLPAALSKLVPTGLRWGRLDDEGPKVSRRELPHLIDLFAN